ncbi:YgjP-like metallopeptidase domain-containing protein [Undibacterium sp. MH2W]|uniref:M48 family metallopeptidase n=1 Tax=Undibacterium sp. MH2W TaxID=3413044 RepID=UPI003BF18970
MSSIVKALQLALQLDLFSDFLSSERPKPTPTQTPKRPSVPPKTPTPVIEKEVVPPLSPAPDNTSSINKRRILLNDILVEYVLQRSTRRSIGFLINDHGLRITAPRWATIAAIESAIQEKQRWILTKLSERQERVQQRPRTKALWGDGTRLPYLGQEIILRVSQAASQFVRFDHDAKELHLCLLPTAGQTQLKARVQQWFQQQAKKEFQQRLPGFAEQLQVRYQKISLTSARTRWGSCTSEGNIRLNWRLIHFSPSIIDYVIAHEVAHLREMNHSPQFWATVAAIYPDYETARQALRQHATADLPDFAV